MQKVCPKCKLVQGVTNQTCRCGHLFRTQFSVLTLAPPPSIPASEPSKDLVSLYYRVAHKGGLTDVEIAEVKRAEAKAKPSSLHMSRIEAIDQIVQDAVDDSYIKTCDLQRILGAIKALGFTESSVSRYAKSEIVNCRFLNDCENGVIPHIPGEFIRFRVSPGETVACVIDSSLVERLSSFEGVVDRVVDTGQFVMTTLQIMFLGHGQTKTISWDQLMGLERLDVGVLIRPKSGPPWICLIESQDHVKFLGAQLYLGGLRARLQHSP